jgi:hypothetical protein
VARRVLLVGVVDRQAPLAQGQGLAPQFPVAVAKDLPRRDSRICCGSCRKWRSAWLKVNRATCSKRHSPT